MNNTDLPPIPKAGENGPEVCTTVRLYLAVLDDLPAEQVRVLFEHVSTCAGCAAELRLLTLATYLTNPTDMTPPPQVDQVVLRAIAARSNMRLSDSMQAMHSHRRLRTHRLLWLIGHVAAVVMLLLTLTAVHFLGGPVTTPQAVALPANLSWSGYVLFYRETKVGMNGVHYSVNCYHDLSTGRMHVETMAGSGLDIVAVGDDQALLGEDLIHHIAQWGATAWSVDDSIFNLAQLRSDLQAKRAVYEGMDLFHGQQVYRIRWSNGLVLLLDRHYWPVNVLRDAHGPGTGQPIYEMLTWLKVSQVPSTLWDIGVPAGFHMGRLPARP